MLNKYKHLNYEYLMFGEDLPEPDEHNELIQENAKLEENMTLPVFHKDRFEEDKRLFSEHIESFNDLRNAYFLIKTKELQKSASIRKMVIEKYEALSEYFI